MFREEKKKKKSSQAFFFIIFREKSGENKTSLMLWKKLCHQMF